MYLATGSTGTLAQATAQQKWVPQDFLYSILPPSYSADFIKYRNCALKSRSKLRAAIGLRASLDIFLLHQNSSLFTVTFGEKILTLANSCGP